MVNSPDFDENENPNFIDGCNIEGKQGAYIKGKDVIHLDAPEICFPENAPLDTEKRELYDILNELFQGGGEGGDWQPPDDWIPVPEPEPYDIYILILASTKTGMNFSLALGRESNNDIGYGHIHCDWGDGTDDDYYQWGYPQHTYTEEGQYLVHIIADENSSFWRNLNYSQARWQIVKTGKNIAFVTDYNEQNGYYPNGQLFPNKNYLKYVQINHPRGLPNKNVYLFQSCNVLQKIKLKKKLSDNVPPAAFQSCFDFSDFDSVVDFETIETINTNAFGYCYNLTGTIVLPNCTSIGKFAFTYCYGLKKIYLPNCTFIDEGAFCGCYNLQEVVVAEDCTFGTNCFQSCYSLYPRPDGSQID